MSAKKKPRGRKIVAHGHKDTRRKKRSNFIMFVGRFDRRQFRAIRAGAKRNGQSTAAALRDLVDKAIGVAPAAVEKSKSALIKASANSPMLIVSGRDAIAVKAGTRIGRHIFAKNTPIVLPATGLEIGADYGVRLKGGMPVAERLSAAPGIGYFGGFHFAPGGDASADRGGDDQPAINPCSLWDVNFRPACPDPRGMVLVEADGKKFWVDIYLLAADHLANGTSQFGVKIADGNDPPENPAGGRFSKLDCATAVAVMKHHGKGLLAPEEFYAAAAGVTERSSANGDPKVSGLDAPRTSKFGLMQATGNLWVWGHDGTSERRASLFGGSWMIGDDAGSRYANVAYYWPGVSNGVIGARGRSDHLQPV